MGFILSIVVVSTETGYPFAEINENSDQLNNKQNAPAFTWSLQNNWKTKK